MKHAIIFAIVLSFTIQTTPGQSKHGKKTATDDSAASRAKPTVLLRESKTTSPESGPAVTNAQLRTELNWLLGGKQQRGWYLYSALIGRLLDTKAEVTSEAFATALKHWQKKSGLPQTGLLDEESFYAMVSQWQEARLKDRTPATPDQLLMAPTADFYDPTREDELRLVERKTYEAYKHMVAAAVSDRSLGLASDHKGELAANEKYLKIISSFRSREYQDRLRQQSPDAGSAGLAVNSPHFTGRALDLYVGGEPVETKDSNRAVQVNTRVYQWLVRNAERFGFRPYFYEPWHWEYVK